MDWKQGQPCSACGNPTEVVLHEFSGGGKTWKYFAPLYHNVDENLGFCEPNCVIKWMNANAPSDTTD